MRRARGAEETTEKPGARGPKVQQFPGATPKDPNALRRGVRADRRECQECPATVAPTPPLPHETRAACGGYRPPATSRKGSLQDGPRPSGAVRTRRRRRRREPDRRTRPLESPSRAHLPQQVAITPVARFVAPAYS